MRSNSIRFVSTHRLDPEKGRDLILCWLKIQLSKETSSTGAYIEYDIYGDGVLRPQVEELSKQYPDQIHYLGYVPLKKVFEHSKDYDFVMMPSCFLETFGLSALDFAQFGIPTIGYKKGGATPFILDSLNITHYTGKSTQDQFNNALDTIIAKTLEERSNGIERYYTIDKDVIKSTYGQEHRLQHFKSLLNIN